MAKTKKPELATEPMVQGLEMQIHAALTPHDFPEMQLREGWTQKVCVSPISDKRQRLSEPFPSGTHVVICVYPADAHNDNKHDNALLRVQGARSYERAEIMFRRWPDGRGWRCAKIAQDMTVDEVNAWRDLLASVVWEAPDDFRVQARRAYASGTNVKGYESPAHEMSAVVLHRALRKLHAKFGADVINAIECAAREWNEE